MSQRQHVPTASAMVETAFARVGVDPFTAAFDLAASAHPPHGHGRSVQPTEAVELPFADWAPQLFEERQAAPLCLYLHVPFCRHRCAFCPFYRYQCYDGFSADYARLLRQDIALTAQALGEDLPRRRVDAVYFGGGTPSDLEGNDLAAVMADLKARHGIDARTEITVEGRFRDFTPEKAAAWVGAGANRFSLGLQSSDERLRRRLGRLAGRDEIRRVIADLSATGALVIVDLIFGLPGQTIAMLEEDIRFLAEETTIDGLDLYELKQFPGSPLAKMLETGRLPAAPVQTERGRAYAAACAALAAQGFEHFTLQHWRRTPRERSLYNRLAKVDADLLPFGSGAGGRLGRLSIARDPALDGYRQALENGQIPARYRQTSENSQRSFPARLAGAVEDRTLPPISSWPESTLPWKAALLENWREAGLIESWPSTEEPVRLTAAGCYWAPHLQSLLTRLAMATR
ncbi:MAG: radical SAM protein [Verrucomicrobiota bacterium JB022]|nr:radical SAM protein [Verrucomicrobiota bacterium JB022]